PPLATGLVHLRLPRDDDADWIANACRDPEMRRWIPHMPTPYERSDAVAHIDRSRLQWSSGGGAMFVIAGGDTGVGLIELAMHEPEHASVGYWVAAPARRRGMATDALRLVSDWALVTLGVARISLTTDPDNVASQGVAARAGYEREGLLRAWQPTPDGRRDSVMYSRTHRDAA
ncbi:MAG TPA: GNAT family N-acetyltransferase, partial [Gaiellales bacterium]